MTTFLACLGFLALLASPLAHADTSSAALSKILLLDRIAISLTKEPASIEQKSLFLKGELTLEEFIGGFQRDPRFTRNLAEFWNTVLGINAAPNIFEITRKDGRTLSQSMSTLYSLSLQSHHRSVPPHVKNFETSWVVRAGTAFDLQTPSDDLISLDFDGNGTPELWHNALSDCGCYNGRTAIGVRPEIPASCPQTVRVRTGGDGQPVRDSLGYLIPATGSEPAIELRNDNVANIRPWWNPEITIPVCKLLTHPSYCGPDLRGCWYDPGNRLNHLPSTFTLYPDVEYGFAMEAGMIMATAVASDWAWSDVLTTSFTVLNESALFLLNDPVQGGALREGLYGSASAFSNTPTNMNPTNVSSFRTVDRGLLRAGILATAAFHTSTNGWRAKANRVREALLCTSFSPPQSAQIESDIADLTIRPYCSHCHATLEPLSRSFAQFPNSDNFFFDPQATVTGGSYAGQDISHLEELSLQFTKEATFHRCAAERAFQFLAKRQLSQDERKSLLPALEEAYRSANGRLWPVLKAVLTHASFAGPAVEATP